MPALTTHRRDKGLSCTLGAVLHVRFVADIGQPIRDVRFTPESGHAERQHRRPLSANNGHSRRLMSTYR